MKHIGMNILFRGSPTTRAKIVQTVDVSESHSLAEGIKMFQKFGHSGKGIPVKKI